MRDEHPPLVGTIELTNKIKYGITSRKIPMYLFTPYNKRYPHFIVGCSEKDTTKNKIALITIGDWSSSSTFPRGLLMQVLGVSGEYDVEVKALIWQACPWKYPTYDYKPEQKKHTSKQRTVLSGYTFHIDPKGCKDVDDVLTFELIDNNWKVTITISDVASYVEDGDAIDIMASIISQTLYDNKGQVIRPMLPSEYSEKVCSLLPGKDSYGISLQFIWNGNEIKDICWFESIFITNKSYTYEEFQTSDSLYKKPLEEIVSYLAKESIKDSHKWIEYMMIFYNMEAGKILKNMGMGILRRHSEPNMEKLKRYKTHIPELQQLAYSSAEYCLAEEKETTHFGIGSIAYAHVSSPIRRYADLINQRVLKLYINNSKNYYIVPQAMYDMNLREKTIKRFSQDMFYLDAIFSENDLKGIILEKKILDNNFVKIKLYVPYWKKIISTTYKYVSENTVLSRDETTTINVSEYNEVHIKCTFNLQLRNWKERTIINILN